MRVVNRNGEANVAYTIEDIEGDMGEPTRMQCILQADGDVVLTLIDREHRQRISIEFCTPGSGGGRNPIIHQKLREIIIALAKGAGT